MKHVVVDVAEEGGIHQIRARYGEIQRFSSRKRAFVGLQRPFSAGKVMYLEVISL